MHTLEATLDGLVSTPIWEIWKKEIQEFVTVWDVHRAEHEALYTGTVVAKGQKNVANGQKNVANGQRNVAKGKAKATTKK